MFCAKAGAKQVFAVDRSEIINKARENIFRNGLSDKITCIRGMIEDIDLPVQKVDIIISEWMGYCLLYEAMLQSVLAARDKFLKPDGLLVPSFTTLWIAPISDSECISDQITFWRDVYGFDMQAMQAGIYDDARIQTMPSSAICGTPFPFVQLPLHSILAKDLTFSYPWATTISRDTDSLDGFLIWFDTYFTQTRDEAVPVNESAEAWAEKKENRVAFTTGPSGRETHWKQGLLLLDREKLAPLAPKQGVELKGKISYSAQPDNPRALSIGMTWPVSEHADEAQIWNLR
jgi:type I protein arginine methyltransferase